MSAKSVLPFILPILLPILACSKSETPPPANKSETKVQQTTVESDLEVRRQFVSEIEQHLDKEEFDELETIADRLTKHRDRFPGGDWMIDRFYEAIYPPSGYETVTVNWPDRITKLKKWIQQKPNSIYANVGLASAQAGNAWDARGSGYGSEVADDQMLEFKAKLKQAEATLNKMYENRNKCVHWYRAMQAVGLGLGYDPDTMSNLLNQAIAIEPLYWSVYNAHALYLLPRWYGDEGEWLKFAEEYSNKIGGDEGDILYSEICWRTSRAYSVTEFFKDKNISWGRIKKGFKARGQKYGVSVRYLNAYCLLAGGIGDKQTSRVLINRIGDQWEPDFWKEKKYFDAYKKWASE
jgi:hypothetical protein